MHVPRATYRLQFNEQFRLRDALALVPFLRDLGVSHVYSSPLFQAAPHSVHGYDVCDFGRLNPELGDEADLQALADALHRLGMGLVLDIVPNHMGITSPDNHWWWDVLKHGPASRFAGHFDIDWNSPDPELRGKILAPILGDTRQRALERRELQLRLEDAGPVLAYADWRFPLTPGSAPAGPEDLARLNSDPAALDQLIRRQFYLPACWRDGDLKLNYRRFFAVSTLAALRVEDQRVFDDVHALLRRWIANGWIDGLRVDHPDGLRDPENYLRRLRALAPDLWIVVEKILQPGESLPPAWPVQGTTGYDFLNPLNGLFIDPASADPLAALYSAFTGEPADPATVVRAKKRLVLNSLFVTEVNRLALLLLRLAARHPPHASVPLQRAQAAIVEFTAALPVYRTYARPHDHLCSDDDSHFIRQAAIRAAESAALDRPPLQPLLAAESSPLDLPVLLDFLRDLLLLRFPGDLEDEFIARFQQFTGAVMAKGVEDTAFYCLNRLASLNEVGADPARFGADPAEFHQLCRRRSLSQPHSMLTTSTHDTKRSEDVRARMNLLSQIPGEWRAAVLRWSRMNARHRRNNFPDRNLEFLFYQTLVGAWPISRDRLLAYMEKGSCEAKQHTDWNNRNAEYDAAVVHFVTAAIADPEFIRDLERFLALLLPAAQTLALAQTLLKLTAPGVPDIYQGNEIWDFSLVDPDNRRPVDFELRRRLLAEARNLSAREIWQRRDDGLPKLWLIQKTLAVLAALGDLSGYEPLPARGERADHVAAFIRGGRLAPIVPRFPRLPAPNSEFPTPIFDLPPGIWRNEFTGLEFNGGVSAADLFADFPVALLMKKG